VEAVEADAETGMEAMAMKLDGWVRRERLGLFRGVINRCFRL